MLFCDGPRGVFVKQVKIRVFYNNASWCTFDVELERRVGNVIGTEVG